MYKPLFFLFLFFSCLYSATINVHTNIPSDMTAGSIYPINYTLCLNTAQNYTLNFNMTNTTYNFSLDGSEFNFTNCDYNSTKRLYVCPRYGEVGNNKIEMNMSVNTLTQKEDYIVRGFIELYSESEYGVCNPAPVIVPASSSGGSSGVGSGGGSFSVPRPSIKPKEPVKVEPEPPKEVPKEEPKAEPLPKPVEEPKEEEVKEEEPTILTIPADSITEGTDEETDDSIPLELILLGGVIVVGLFLVLVIIFREKIGLYLYGGEDV